ncbi:MAG TPA: rhamnulokinase [Candidatus Pullichristensenella stercorigallinarum]|uniref:Rhamnulokinase n=1 Tax=Candidatus Pullichristensenella stercorigallinarum TaxID=2840909 RepID=A0A9D0ZM25_9FIRM|nr:rhamnulokinase [Candidatus Pullichristensenella stercorigallinarum]
MKKTFNFLGFDFGASSGRAMLGVFDGERVEIRELHRFLNEPVDLVGRFSWDVPRLFFEMKQALNKAAKEGLRIDAIGIDTWGVDFGLVDKNGYLLGNPVHYRDARTDGVMEKAFAVMPQEEIFRHTGLAFMQFNTLYQLYAMKLEGDPTLEAAEHMLMMPDLLAYLLTGKMGTEYTIASTSQLIDPFTRDWDFDLIDRFGLPRRVFTPIQPSGTVRGTLLPQIAKECGVSEIPVIAVASHDTASAVAAIPVADPDFAYISSGTWSLLGAEIRTPLCEPGVMRANYTNEGGIDGTIRLLKNIMGLWIIQECKREWDRRADAVSFAQIVEMAEKADPFIAFVDVDDPCFLAPNDMPARIQAYCQKTGQRVPQSRGEIARVVYENLAFKYRWAVERLEKDMLKKRVNVLHIVGGGSKNDMLNRFTADAINRPVIAGPDEGTVIGNLLVQAMGLGALKDLAALRRVVENSFPTRRFEPENAPAWDAAYAKYLEVVKK